MRNKEVRFKPLGDKSRNVVNTIIGSKPLPIAYMKREFGRLLMKYKLAGYLSFEDFSSGELQNICSFLCSMLNINYGKIYCELLGSGNGDCYLHINIPIQFLLGAGFDVNVRHKDFEEGIYSEITISKFREDICTLCSCIDRTPYNYIGVGLNMNGELGFIISHITPPHSRIYDFYSQRFVDVTYDFIEFLP